MEISKRTHKKQVEASKTARHLSSEKARAEKNLRAKARSADRKEVQAKLVQERLDAWRELSPAQQLATLDRRLGKGVGAEKQRIKLTELLA